MPGGEAGCWMCLSQEASAKDRGAGWVPGRNRGVPAAGEALSRGPAKGRGAASQAHFRGLPGRWLDGWLREKGRNLSCLKKAPRLPTEHVASSVGLRGFTPSCPAASQQGSPRFQRESTLPYFHKKDWMLPPNPPIHSFLHGRWPWLRPPMAHGAGEPGGLETERGRRFVQLSLGCNKLKQKQLPLSKSPVPSPRTQLHCRCF